MMIHRRFTIGNVSENERRLVRKDGNLNKPSSFNESKLNMPLDLNNQSDDLKNAEITRLKIEVQSKNEQIRNLSEASDAMNQRLKTLEGLVASFPKQQPDGQVSYPDLQNRSISRSSAAKKIMHVRGSRYYGRGSAYMQHFPKRYVRNVVRPPVVRIERPDKPKSPYRTRYNRIDGLYYEMLDAATGQYVRGPNIQSQKQILEQRKLDEARHKANREGALMIMRDFNKGRHETTWNYQDQVRALESLGRDAYNARPKSVRMAEVHRDVSIGMAMPEGPAYDMPLEQSRTFRTYLETRGSPVAWHKDGSGNLIFKRVEKVDGGATIEIQEHITRSGELVAGLPLQSIEAPTDTTVKKTGSTYDERWNPTSYGENIPFPS